MLQVPLKNIVSLSEARHHFSGLITKAMNNESFLITKGGKPVVIITGIEMIEQLYRQGIIATEAETPKKKKAAESTDGIDTNNTTNTPDAPVMPDWSQLNQVDKQPEENEQKESKINKFFTPPENK